MSATRAVREDQHGTATGYSYGCRCDRCRTANAEYRGFHAVDECIVYAGSSSLCSNIAAQLVDAESEVRRYARAASRSEASFRRHAGNLARAKTERENKRAIRDSHMAECPAALARFGGVA